MKRTIFPNLAVILIIIILAVVLVGVIIGADLGWQLTTTEGPSNFDATLGAVLSGTQTAQPQATTEFWGDDLIPPLGLEGRVRRLSRFGEYLPIGTFFYVEVNDSRLGGQRQVHTYFFGPAGESGPIVLGSSEGTIADLPELTQGLNVGLGDQIKFYVWLNFRSDGQPELYVGARAPSSYWPIWVVLSPTPTP